MEGCLFCSIVDGVTAAEVVLADDVAVGFLDHRPVFKGHVVVVPRHHVVTLAELDGALLGPLFEQVQLLSKAVVVGMGSQGSLVLINNVISQSVPHLHVHVIPRRRGDGLRGFLWPRLRYADEGEQREVGSRLREAVRGLLPPTTT